MATKRKTKAAAGAWGVPKLQGKTFHFTGRLQHWDRDQATERIESEGGAVAETVTAALDYLIVGEVKSGRPSGAEKQALRLNDKKSANIRIIEEAAYLALFSPTREELLAVLANPPDSERWRWMRGGDRRVVPMPDLGRADLRAVRLAGLDLFDIHLDGADLRDADLTRAAFDARNARLDGARLVDALPRDLRGSSLIGSNLSRSNLNTAILDGADLTNATLTEVRAPYFSAVGAVFRGADLHNAELSESPLIRADFTGATLTDSDLHNCDFTEAKFIGACLEKADLTGAKLIQADLSDADLRGANLARADLTDAVIDGANFEDANLSGAKIDTLDAAKAKGLRPTVNAVGKAGPNVTKLAKITGQCKRFETSAEFEMGEDRLILQVGDSPYGASAYCNLYPKQGGGIGRPGEGKTLAACFTNLAHKWSRARPRLESITAKADASPVDKKTLRELVVAAWCEVFAVKSSPIEELMKYLQSSGNASSLDKALQMLRDEGFQLFSQVETDSLIGVVKSRSSAERVYSCRLAADGSFACCTQNLRPCGGLRGSLCKHLLVLVVGLTRNDQLDPATAHRWVEASQKQRPTLDKDIMSATFMRYKGAEAGEIDWRPTETIPEDYYAL